MKVYITSDHGGFALKQNLTQYLTDEGYEVEDLGPKTLDPGDDYPIFASKLAKEVVSHPGTTGIAICRNGVGISIAANKFLGVRCALSWNPEHAASARNDDDANILALPSDYLSAEVAEQTVHAWLITPFAGDEKHLSKDRFIRRIKQVEELEKTK